MADRTLSDYERLYITEGIKEDLRADGRSCRDYRHFELKTGVVSNTSGSAEIRLVGGALNESRDYLCRIVQQLQLGLKQKLEYHTPRHQAMAE